MENYSNLISNDFVVVYQENDNELFLNEYHFKFFGTKHYAQIEIKNNKYSVVFDRDIFEFDNLEDFDTPFGEFHSKMNTTEILSALGSLKYVLEEFPLEKHLGEALNGIYLRLLEAM